MAVTGMFRDVGSGTPSKVSVRSKIQKLGPPSRVRAIYHDAATEPCGSARPRNIHSGHRPARPATLSAPSALRSLRPSEPAQDTRHRPRAPPPATTTATARAKITRTRRAHALPHTHSPSAPPRPSYSNAVERRPAHGRPRFRAATL